MVHYKVFFLFDLVFCKASAREYAFDVLGHLRVTTGVRDSVSMIKPKPVGMLTQHILYPTSLALPIGFFPRPADGRNIFEPSGV